MTTLTIEQGNNIEIVSNAVIQKLYETVLDSTNVTLSGNLQCEHCFENVYDYLTGYITEGVKRFPDLAINVTDGKYISFADPEVQRVLVSLTGNDAISSDGIGITQAEAANCPKLKNDLFENNTTIVSFDELGKFSKNGQFQIGDKTFRGATNLESIDLSTVTSTGTRAFNGCSKLRQKINMPSLTNTGGAVFAGSGITEVENLGTVTALWQAYGIGYFASCTNLTKVIIPPTCTYLEGPCFADCTNLTQINNLDALTRLGEQCFAKLNYGIMYFPNVTQAKACFCGVGSTITTIKQFYAPKLDFENDTQGFLQIAGGGYYKNGAFACLVSDLVYLKDISRLNGAAFSKCNIQCLVINNATPPSIYNNKGLTGAEWDEWLQENGSTFYGRDTDLFVSATIGSIYVPDSAVNTYKTTAIWSDKASIIKPISELTKVATEADLQDGQIALIEAYMGTTSNS